MKRFALSMIALTAATATVFVTSCDWSSGSQANFNTSNQSSLTNISGFYQASRGGRAVNGTSRGNINSLTIQQSGNRVEVVDNQGSRYTGSVGAPLLVNNLGDSSIATGALLSTYQISWSGRDGVAALDIEFTGTINLVAVQDITGETANRETERVVTTSTDGVVTNASGSVTTTERNTSDTSGTTSERIFRIGDASTQLRLRGTWVEKGGRVATVDARAAGIRATLTSQPGGQVGGDGSGNGGGDDGSLD